MLVGDEMLIQSVDGVKGHGSVVACGEIKEVCKDNKRKPLQYLINFLDSYLLCC